MNGQSIACALDSGSAADAYRIIGATARTDRRAGTNVPRAKHDRRHHDLTCATIGPKRDERSSIAQVHLIVKSGELVDLFDRCAALSKLDETFEVQLARYSGAKENKEVCDLVVACILEAVNGITGNVNEVSGLSHDQSRFGGNSKSSPEKIEGLAEVLVVMRTRPVCTRPKFALEEAEVAFANGSSSEVTIARSWTGRSLVRFSIDPRLRSGITHRSARFWTMGQITGSRRPSAWLGSGLNHAELGPSLLFARGTSSVLSRTLIGRDEFTECLSSV
jgi:hypothetical protein